MLVFLSQGSIGIGYDFHGFLSLIIESKWVVKRIKFMVSQKKCGLGAVLLRSGKPQSLFVRSGVGLVACARFLSRLVATFSLHRLVCALLISPNSV